MSRLTGKTAVVFGASSGMGAAIVRSLHAEGATVLACARREPELAELCEPLERAAFTRCDVTEMIDVSAAFAAAAEHFGHAGVDLVVNCAGVMYYTLTKNSPQFLADAQQTVAVNCLGLVHVGAACAPLFVAQRRGHLVVVSSDAALQTFPALTAYNASKAFVHSYATGLRAELTLVPGCRVTELQPGDVRTGLVLRNSDGEALRKVGVTGGELVGGGGGADFDRASVLDAQDVADCVLFAVTAPAHVGINTILVEPKGQMWGDATIVGE